MIRLAQSLALAASLHERTHETHCQQVADLPGRIADALALDQSRVLSCRVAGWLHDVGKIGIPDHILTKPGPLDPAECQTIRTHPALGQDILNRIPVILAVESIRLTSRPMTQGVNETGSTPDRLDGLVGQWGYFFSLGSHSTIPPPRVVHCPVLVRPVVMPPVVEQCQPAGTGFSVKAARSCVRRGTQLRAVEHDAPPRAMTVYAVPFWPLNVQGAPFAANPHDDAEFRIEAAGAAAASAAATAITANMTNPWTPVCFE